MQHRIAKNAILAGVLAGLAGFSSLGFAQSEALQALDAQQAEQNSASTAYHPEADALAAELDAFNRQDTAGRVVGDRVPADQSSQHVSRMARQLSHDLDAYNASATEGRVPSTHMPATADQSPNPTSQALAAELTRYNETGGSLSAVRF